MYTDSFFRFLRHEKRYSEHTIQAYQTDLNQFFAFLIGTFEMEDYLKASHTHIRSWLVSMMEKEISARTINRKISTLKTFYKFHLKKGYISENPLDKVKSPKVSKRLPVFVEEEKTRILFNQVDHGEGFPGTRNKLLVELLYATGIRLSELIGLKELDVDKSNQSIKVLGKGNKERIIPIDKNIILLIREYVEEKRKTFGQEAASYLLVTDKGKKLYPKLVYRTVKEFLGKATTIDKKSPHVLRHTFATHLSNNGADLNAIKELLGHASLAATQVYTHNTIEKLKDIHKQAHPKA